MNYYVSKSGNDSNNGLSVDTPIQTLNEGFSRGANKDTLRIKAGDDFSETIYSYGKVLHMLAWNFTTDEQVYEYSDAFILNVSSGTGIDINGWFGQEFLFGPAQVINTDTAVRGLNMNHIILNTQGPVLVQGFSNEGIRVQNTCGGGGVLKRLIFHNNSLGLGFDGNAAGDLFAVRNCVFYSNTIGISDCNQINASTIKVTNNIFLNNTYMFDKYSEAPSKLYYSFCCYLGDISNPIPPLNPPISKGNNLNTNPLMKNPTTGDYTLQSNSPCINAGDPMSPRDPDGTFADIGVFYTIQKGIWLPPATNRLICNYEQAFKVGEL